MYTWQNLNSDEQSQILSRPAQADATRLQAATQQIIDSVKTDGDKTLVDLNKEFDNNTLPLIVSNDVIERSCSSLDDLLKNAIDLAYSNIKQFHSAQLPTAIDVETQPGVRCELRYQAIESVGIYVPGGSAPLPSSVLMQATLAQLSGATNIVLCTPTRDNEIIHPAICYAAKLCGVTTIVNTGGAGAIAAMAFGTQSVPKVDKIFGPGNSYVTMAKQLVSQQVPGLAIDMPAGPSELLVIADELAEPSYVAADLLSQAEHGPDSQVVLLCNSERVISEVTQQLDTQLASLSRRTIAEKALANSPMILVDSIEQAVAISNEYGPEHLIIQTEDASDICNQCKNAGSIFVGKYTPESAGDYASGTNHVLPTYGYSRSFSSLNLLDFYRTYTVQTISKGGLQRLSTAILPLADAEGLDAHANAVSIRLGESK